MNKLRMKVTPMKVGKYYEPCMIAFSNGDVWYPTGVVHIDTFWARDGNNKEYKQLMEGREIIFTISNPELVPEAPHD